MHHASSSPSASSRRGRLGLRAGAGLLLATASVVGLAHPALAATTTPTTTLVVPAYINAADDTKVTVSGVADPGDAIALTAKDSTFLSPKSVSGTATAATNGTWTATVDTSTLADGAVSWTATPSAGTTAGTAASGSSTKDTAAPGAPATVTASPAPYTTATSTLTVAGTTSFADRSAALTVDVTVTDSAGKAISLLNQPVTAATGLGLSGSFSVVFPAAQVATLADGALTVSALFHDAAGNAGTPTTATDEKGKLALVSVSPADATTVSSPSTVSATYNQKLSGSGSGTTSSIAVKNSAGTAVTGTSATSGSTVTWTPGAALPDGTYAATTTVYDAAYTSETATDTWHFTVSSAAAPAAPIITTFTDPINLANEKTVTVSGTADVAGQPVAVKVGTLTQTASTATDHTWSLTVDVSTLPEGNVFASATQTGTNGKTSTAGTKTSVKDTVAPKETQAAPANGSTVQSAKAVGFAFDETMGSGTITLTPAGSTTPVAGTSTVSGKTVIFTPSATLPDGTYTATVTAADAAGNPATGTLTTTFTVNSSAVTSTTTLAASAASVVRGTKVTLSGAVKLSSGTATGSVELYATADSGGAPIDLGSLALDATGAFHVTFAPGVGATYYATYTGGSGVLASTSPKRHVAVAAKVTAATRTGSHTSKATITVTVAPATTGTKVTLKRFASGSYRQIATGKLSKGHATFKVTLPKGSTRLQVVVAKTASNTAGSTTLVAKRT